MDFIRSPRRPTAVVSVGHLDTQLYWQTIFPSGCEQNSTFPVQRSSRCTPIDDETICHLKSIANEIAMSTVATITVTGIRKFITQICPRRLGYLLAAIMRAIPAMLTATCIAILSLQFQTRRDVRRPWRSTKLIRPMNRSSAASWTRHHRS